MVDRPLRIVFVIPFDPYYQPFTIRTIMFCRHLTARGHSVRLFYVSVVREKRTVRVHKPPLGAFDVSPLNLADLDQAISDCDVVHLQKAFPRTVVPALALAHRHGKPVHYDWDDDDFAFCVETAGRALHEIRHARRGFLRLGKALGGAVAMALLEQAMPRAATTVGVASMDSRARCVKLGVPPRTLFAAPVGVDSEAFQPDARNSSLRQQLGFQGPAVVYSGYFDWADDIEWFVEALSALRGLAPQVGVLVVGGGAARAKLAAMIERRALGAWLVQTTDFVPFADMPRWLASCEVAAMPLRDTPRNRSKSSLTAMESMACGLPIVTHAVGDMPWIVGAGGVVVREDTPFAFAEAIANLINDPARCARLGAAARERARENFRWEQTVDQLERAYRAATDGSCTVRTKR